MSAGPLPQLLETQASSAELLRAWGVRDPERGWRILRHLAEALGMERLQALAVPLGRRLSECPDSDMALNNLERFFANPAGAARFPDIVHGPATLLETLVQLLSTSQYFSDLLTAHPEDLEMAGISLRDSPGADELRRELQAAVDGALEHAAILRAFRRFRQRHILRIGTNDVIRDRPLEEVTRSISAVADAALEVALQTAVRRVAGRFGEPHTASGDPARCVVLAFGKLGGIELNYSSDIDLMFVYDEEGVTRGHGSAVGNDDFFARVVGEVVRLLTTHTADGQAYRVDLRLRPEGREGPLARSLQSTLAYYDTLGRTWERQALIKLRPVAGDQHLGGELLRALEPFVYRQYLNFAEINEIKALKRTVERAARRAGGPTDVKTGHGGIRDVEFAVQFLQLLNGGDLPAVRQANTLQALQALERSGCLTDQEFHILDDAYRFLRRVEHRLQLLFDLQTHILPRGADELAKLALRVGATPRSSRRQEPPVRPGTRRPGATARRAFLADFREKTRLNRKILDHLLHQTFAGQEAPSAPESDLVLDPEPATDVVESVLRRYGFRDVPGAYQNLIRLAREDVPFLSSRRCRHFLASVAPRLLRAVAETADPDLALANLEKVTASLGGKGLLWELFSSNPPSLRLYVDLCASSSFLSEILITNPGMVDELLDSLVLNQPRPLAELKDELVS